MFTFHKLLHHEDGPPPPPAIPLPANPIIDPNQTSKSFCWKLLDLKEAAHCGGQLYRLGIYVGLSAISTYEAYFVVHLNTNARISAVKKRLKHSHGSTSGANASVRIAFRLVGPVIVGLKAAGLIVTFSLAFHSA